MTAPTKRVRIACVTDSIQLPSLNVSLKKGQQYVLPLSAIENPEVQQALRFQAIKVIDMSTGPKKIISKNKKRTQSGRSKGKIKSKPFASMTKKAKGNIPASSTASKPVIQQVTNINNTVEMDEAVVNTIVERVVQAFESTFERLRDTSTPVSTPVVQQAVREVAVQTITKDFEDDFENEAVPMFIPKGIVNEDIQGDVQLNTTTVEDGGLDDVAQALRKLRKNK